MPVARVLRRWRHTQRLFHRHGMACPGCALAEFFTVTEAAAAYGLDPLRFAAELAETIDAAASLPPDTGTNPS